MKNFYIVYEHPGEIFQVDGRSVRARAYHFTDKAVVFEDDDGRIVAAFNLSRWLYFTVEEDKCDKSA